MGTNSITFTGNDTTGYMLWYKEVGAHTYSLCIHKDRTKIPTIPEDLAVAGLPLDWVERDSSNAPIIEYTVYTADLKPFGSTKTFDELKDLGYHYYFAVSSYGDNGEESIKVEFDIWP